MLRFNSEQSGECLEIGPAGTFRAERMYEHDRGDGSILLGGYDSRSRPMQQLIANISLRCCAKADHSQYVAQTFRLAG